MESATIIGHEIFEHYILLLNVHGSPDDLIPFHIKVSANWARILLVKISFSPLDIYLTRDGGIMIMNIRQVAGAGARRDGGYR